MATTIGLRITTAMGKLGKLCGVNVAMLESHTHGGTMRKSHFNGGILEAYTRELRMLTTMVLMVSHKSAMHHASMLILISIHPVKFVLIPHCIPHNIIPTLHMTVQDDILNDA